MSRWRFWIDRGGTFTDVVAIDPDRRMHTRKVLSEHPTRGVDAAIVAIHDLLGLDDDAPIPTGTIETVKMGTTVATNALLERTGEPTLLVITRGFGDALRIGTQARPDLFALDIVLPDLVYDRVLEVDERVRATGEVMTPLEEDAARTGLVAAFADGYRSVAIVCMHGDRHPAHERRLAAIADEIGFTQISASHTVDPLMKLVPRGDTTTVDAYLSPVLGRYLDDLRALLPRDCRLLLMQSNGGLAEAHRFSGKDALLSGPAGGVVGMTATAAAAGFDRLIGFDMGGTSTDVSHVGRVADGFERTSDALVAGVRVRAPMIHIHTVAAGGGSVLHFDGARLRVGPDSAGADPGPASYGNGGPLTVTDANVVLGRLRADRFPRVFGPNGDAALDADAAHRAFEALAAVVSDATRRRYTAATLAEGFVAIAVDNMANAIRRISVQRGHDVTDHTLVCFGGAGGQHACAVADRLGIRRVHIHPLAGVLSAVGIGLAEIRHVARRGIEQLLSAETHAALAAVWRALEAEAAQALAAQGIDPAAARFVRHLSIRVAGSDTSLDVPAGDIETLDADFDAVHRRRFGFVEPGRSLVIEAAQVEGIAPADVLGPVDRVADAGTPAATFDATFDGVTRGTPFIARSTLVTGSVLHGPAVVDDDHATTVIEPGWAATVTSDGDLILERTGDRGVRRGIGTAVDPVHLEIFNNLFTNIAEQMGVVLEQTAASVNIKERLDFSCAVFDPDGELVANAPHMPVHLGSMGEAVRAVIDSRPTMRPGEAYVTNAPYRGGTHLPDVTVVLPVFDHRRDRDPGLPIFFVAARGHHADIGGITPGSAPAHSTRVDEEGVLLDDVLLVADGRFRASELRSILSGSPHPARDPDKNLADLRAQVAACEKGADELHRVIDHHGLDVVHAYMAHVRDNAEESVRRVIDNLVDCSGSSRTDDGHMVAVAIRVDREARSIVVDFTGTSGPHPGNFNAPAAVCRAAVLYVIRCLVADDIPLNAGCMVPVEVIIPTPSLLSPVHPSAVFAGNVETSQLVVDALLSALGAAASSQGTMNNLIFGNDRHQYYETICGGAGATARAPGCSAVQTHMTNSRLTDPEVLEWRFPVVVEEFSIRRGSGGDGYHRGGDGAVRRIRFGEAMEVNIVSSRRVHAPSGLAGGDDGALGRNLIRRADGTNEELPGVAQLDVAAGDVIEIATPGGGGWGPA